MGFFTEFIPSTGLGLAEGLRMTTPGISGVVEEPLSFIFITMMQTPGGVKMTNSWKNSRTGSRPAGPLTELLPWLREDKVDTFVIWVEVEVFSPA
jgi:hypothetical protein